MHLLTVIEAAELLNCSRRHVGRMIELGRLKATDIGLASRKEYRISRQDIFALLDEKQPVKKPKRRRRKPINIIRYV